MRHMRDMLFSPLLSDRSEREKWLAAEAKDARERAPDLAKKYIGNHVSRGISNRSGRRYSGDRMRFQVIL